MEINRILLHLSEMFIARGDDISEFVEHTDAVSRPRYYSEVLEFNTDRTTVFFAMNKDLLRNLLQKTLKEYDDPNEMIDTFRTPNFIIVATEVPQPTMNTLQQRDKKLSGVGGMLQVFLAKELAYNPSKHDLVPHHEKLTEQEAKEVMERYLVKSKAQMPLIHRTDAMARWLGLRHGDIVRIARSNDTSGQYFYYRCCV